jgi:hypothetical protein
LTFEHESAVAQNFSGSCEGIHRKEHYAKRWIPAKDSSSLRRQGAEEITLRWHPWRHSLLSPSADATSSMLIHFKFDEQFSAVRRNTPSFMNDFIAFMN